MDKGHLLIIYIYVRRNLNIVISILVDSQNFQMHMVCKQTRNRIVTNLYLSKILSVLGVPEYHYTRKL